MVIANAQLRVVGTILECGGVSPAARALGGSLVYHAPLQALLTAGRTGHLQLYSTTTDKVLYNVSISLGENAISTRVNIHHIFFLIFPYLSVCVILILT